MMDPSSSGSGVRVQVVDLRPAENFSPELESLRGWAILLVFLYHADFAIVGAGRVGIEVPLVQAFMTAGHTGVTLFFVLSAYLLSRPFLEQATGGRRVRLTGFLARRVMRIMPLYSVAVVLAVLLCMDEPGVLMAGVRSLLFLTSFTGVAHSLLPYNAVWWSLAVEAQFYFLLIGLGLCLRSRAGRGVVIAILIAWASAYWILLTDHSLVSWETHLQLSLTILGRAPAFLAGVIAAWVVSRFGVRLKESAHDSVVLTKGGADLLLMGALLALGLILQDVTRLGFFEAEILWTVWHLGESMLWAVIMMLVILTPMKLASVISNQVMATIGLLSYSMYLVHEPILHFGLTWIIERGVPIEEALMLRAGVLIGAFCFCLAISAASYRWIERPFLERKAHVIR